MCLEKQFIKILAAMQVTAVYIFVTCRGLSQKLKNRKIAYFKNT